MRSARDICVRTLGQLMNAYHKGGEPLQVFMKRAMALMRLYLEEGFHRCLLAAVDDSLRMAALCSLMATLRNFEAETLTEDLGGMGLFVTFTEANLKNIGKKVKEGEATSVELMPSYIEVVSYVDMRVEAFSLKVVRASPSSIVMSKKEVRALIDGLGGKISEGRIVPGREGPSPFEAMVQ